MLTPAEMQGETLMGNIFSDPAISALQILQWFYWEQEAGFSF